MALGFSSFYGFKASDIFGVSTVSKNGLWKFHQWWLNFTGSICGWAILWILIPKAYSLFFHHSGISLNILDFVSIAFAYIGITGHMPMAIVGVVKALGNIFLGVLGIKN